MRKALLVLMFILWEALSFQSFHPRLSACALFSTKKPFFDYLSKGDTGSLPEPSPIVDNMIKALALENPPLSNAFTKDRTDTTWKIIYAPHISVLQKVLFTKFTVYYKFLSDQNSIESNVHYKSKLFGTGWLNTAGKYQITPDGVCKLRWNNIWWDVRSVEQGPSALVNTSEHVLPRVIQGFGETAFVESVSMFPLIYLDDDLCIFDFKLLGTRISATLV